MNRYRILVLVILIVGLGRIYMTRAPQSVQVPEEAARLQLPSAAARTMGDPTSAGKLKQMDELRRGVAQLKQANTAMAAKLKEGVEQARQHRAGLTKASIVLSSAYRLHFQGHDEQAQNLLGNPALKQRAAAALAPMRVLLKVELGRKDRQKQAAGEQSSEQESQARGQVNQALDQVRALKDAEQYVKAYQALQNIPKQPAPDGEQAARIKTLREEIEPKAIEAGRQVWREYDKAMNALRQGNKQEARRLFEGILARPTVLAPEAARHVEAHLATIGKVDWETLIAQGRQLMAQGRHIAALEHLRYVRRLSARIPPKPAQELDGLLQACNRAIILKAPHGMVGVGGGTFTMGGNAPDARKDERHEHVLNADVFYIDEREVSCREYQEFLVHIKENRNASLYVHADDTRQKWEDFVPRSKDPEDQPYCWKGIEYPARMGDCPVVLVTYWDAYAYARWKKRSLPTEVQWEKAARGTKGLRYPWGNTFDAARCSTREGGNDLKPVDAFPDDSSAYGILHLAGNVREWCHDYYNPTWYTEGPDRNPRGPGGGTKQVIRGGSYLLGKDEAITFRRGSADPGYRARDLGFRCALLPADPATP